MKSYKSFEVPKLDFKEAVKKPIKIKCIQMNEPFEVVTIEGTMKGQSGDWLMIGVNGEMYPCANEIFKKTYTICD